MKGFVKDIEGLAVGNDDFRRVLYTAHHCQLVVMSLKPKAKNPLGVTIDELFAQPPMTVGARKKAPHQKWSVPSFHPYSIGSYWR